MVDRERVIAKIQEIFPLDKYIALSVSGDDEIAFPQEKIKAQIMDLINSKENRFADKELLLGVITEDSSRCLALTDKCLFVFRDDITDVEKSVHLIIPYNEICSISSRRTRNSFDMVIYTKDDYSERHTSPNSVIKELSGEGIPITEAKFFSAGIISRICGLLSFDLDSR